jgi:hypothetical protein
MTDTWRLTEQDFEKCFTGEPADEDPANEQARGGPRPRRAPAVTTTTGAVAAAVVVSIAAWSGQWLGALEAVPEARPTPSPVPQERTFLLSPDGNQRIYYSTIQSDPLPNPAPEVKVSAAAAVASAQTVGPPGTPRAALRMISAPDGLSGIPTSPEPIWVVTWFNTPPGLRVGPYRPDPKARELAERRRAEQEASSVCVDVTFVNATTGRSAGLWHLCAPAEFARTAILPWNQSGAVERVASVERALSVREDVRALGHVVRGA